LATSAPKELNYLSEPRTDVQSHKNSTQISNEWINFVSAVHYFIIMVNDTQGHQYCKCDGRIDEHGEKECPQHAYTACVSCVTMRGTVKTAPSFTPRCR